jgi:excisionase family DNA binding protein
MTSLLTISSLANLFQVSSSWLYKQVERNQIPFHRIGANIRFTEEDIEKIIKKFEVKPLILSKEGEAFNGT